MSNEITHLSKDFQGSAPYLWRVGDNVLARLWERARKRWREQCLAWDCTDLELAILSTGAGYIGILIAWCARHAATGVW
jgi:hypothetical protein